jgi:hypothetical protein
MSGTSFHRLDSWSFPLLNHREGLYTYTFSPLFLDLSSTLDQRDSKCLAEISLRMLKPRCNLRVQLYISKHRLWWSRLARLSAGHLQDGPTATLCFLAFRIIISNWKGKIHAQHAPDHHYTFVSIREWGGLNEVWTFRAGLPRQGQAAPQGGLDEYLRASLLADK